MSLPERWRLKDLLWVHKGLIILWNVIIFVFVGLPLRNNYAKIGSGCMNHKTLEIWEYGRVELHWPQRQRGTQITKYLHCFCLIWIAQISSILHLIKLKESRVSIIPSGLTSKVQPLDLTVNRLFKFKLRKKWDDWIIYDYENIKNTKSEKMKTDEWDIIFEWVVSSWDKVNRSTILNGFRVSFGEDRYFPQFEENEIEVNETAPKHCRCSWTCWITWKFQYYWWWKLWWFWRVNK